MGCCRTCARAHPFYVSLKLPVRFCSNLVCGRASYSRLLRAPQILSVAARAHVHTLFSYLRNYWSDWTETLYVGRYHTAVAEALLKFGVPLHVRTCTPLLRISETTGPILLKFGMWPGFIQQIVTRPSDFECCRTCARAHPFFVSPKLLVRLD